MRSAIGFHHLPDAAGAGFLASILHVADAIAHGLDLAGLEDELVPPVSAVAWEAMRLDAEGALRVFAATERQYGEMAAVLVG
jgi:hypothetical protein